MNRPEAYIRRVQWHKDQAQWFWTSREDGNGREHKPHEVRQFPGLGQEVLAEMFNGLCVFGKFNGNFGLDVFRDGRKIDTYPWSVIRWCHAQTVPGIDNPDFWE